MSNRVDGKIPKYYTPSMIARALELRNSGYSWKQVSGVLHKNRHDLCRYCKIAERDGFAAFRAWVER